MQKRILIRVDASQEIGFGHLSRCLAVAHSFKYDLGYEVFFGIKEDKFARNFLKNSGYVIKYLNSENGTYCEKSFLINTLTSNKIDILFLDVNFEFPEQVIYAIKKKGILIADLDDSSSIRILSDLVFLPPLSQVFELKWENFKGKKFIGWDWMPIRNEFFNLKKKLQKKSYLNFKNKTITILITMGGSDPNGFTINALQILNDYINSENIDIELNVIIGDAFAHTKRLDNLKNKLDIKFSIKNQVKNIEDFMAKSDLAFISYGTTAYELAVLEIKSFYFCLTKDHALSAKSFEKNNFGKSFGFQDEINNSLCLEIVKEYINFLNENNIKNNPKSNIYGLGAKNIAKKIDFENYLRRMGNNF